MGTPAYMSPEQREGEPADARTNIYSFGCVLYEMLTAGRVAAQRKRIPSRRLGKVVNRCLEENPERRWQSAAELERELGKVAASTSRSKIAKAAYQEFLSRWNDADRDIPILKQAKAEYAKLQWTRHEGATRHRPTRPLVSNLNCQPK